MTAPRARILGLGAVAVALTGVTLLVMMWVSPGVPVGAVWTIVGVFASAAVPAACEPARVEVIRVSITRAGFAVDYRPIRGATIAHTFGIDRWFDLEPPVPGEELDAWSLGADGRGPLHVRQSDGTWWAASGRLS